MSNPLTLHSTTLLPCDRHIHRLLPHQPPIFISILLFYRLFQLLLSYPPSTPHATLHTPDSHSQRTTPSSHLRSPTSNASFPASSAHPSTLPPRGFAESSPQTPTPGSRSRALWTPGGIFDKLLPTRWCLWRCRGAIMQWNPWTQAVTLWARSTKKVSSAWVMTEEETPWVGVRVSIWGHLGRGKVSGVEWNGHGHGHFFAWSERRLLMWCGLILTCKNCAYRSDHRHLELCHQRFSSRVPPPCDQRHWSCRPKSRLARRGGLEKIP